MAARSRLKSPPVAIAPDLDAPILLIRAQRVMIDSDLARVYGVSTKALNQAVRRNIDRFPADFVLRLSKNEKKEVVTNWGWVKKFC